MMTCQELYKSNAEIRKIINEIEDFVDQLPEEIFTKLLDSMWTENEKLIEKELNIPIVYLRIWYEVDDFFE